MTAERFADPLGEIACGQSRGRSSSSNSQFFSGFGFFGAFTSLRFTAVRLGDRATRG